MIERISRLEQQRNEPVDRVERVQETTDRNFERLRKLGAEEFTGTTEVRQAENWLERMEGVFDQLNCTSHQMTRYAVHMIQGDALVWWKTVPGSRERPVVMEWEDFLTHFKAKYMPKVYQDEKKMEFYTLKQEGKTVVQYEVEFLRLSKYAPEACQTEEDKCSRFLQGLRISIQKGLGALEFDNYAKLLERAIYMEKLIQRERVERAGQKRSNPQYSEDQRGHSGKRGGHSFSQGRGGQQQKGRGYSGSQGDSTNQGFRPPAPTRGGHMGGYHQGDRGSQYAPAKSYYPPCATCGKSHPGMCRLLVNDKACYECGQMGHLKKNCPLLMEN